jgi:hypothetical protein
MSSFLILLGGGLDDSDSDGLFHVSDGESSEGWVLGEGLNAHGLGGLKDDEGRVSVLDELGLFFSGLSCSSVDLGLDLVELAGDVGSVAIEDGGISVFNLTGVVHDDDLGEEGLDFSGGIVLGVTADISSLDVLDGETFNVESDVVSGNSLGNWVIKHFKRSYFPLSIRWGESDVHSGLKDTSLNPTNRYSSNSSDLVHILKWKS